MRVLAFAFASLALLGPLRAGSLRQPAILELFTSQGCSSCPPAEGLMQALDQEQPLAGVEIIPLVFHVDYWDRLGWKDPWASPAFTQRQYAYAKARHSDQVYTPQALVNGRTDIVGHDREAILRALRPVPALTLRVDGGLLRVTGLAPGVPAFVALTQDGLSRRVLRGENEGRTLLGHGVVLRLETLACRDGAASWPLPASRSSHLVVFQQADLGPVLRAGRLRWKK